ncbi:MAG: hypothetical protein JSR59_25875 [Proteobacteria bacterium]|nr:hypothetical protein [Pseudomonadota bacterium]
MTKRAALITLHGLGQVREDYADELIEGVQRKLEKDADEFAFRRVYYQRELQENQSALWQRLVAADRLDYQALRRFMLFGFSGVAGLEAAKEEADSSYYESQLEIARQLLGARTDTGRAAPPLVVVAHSLGGQVFSNYLYDAQRARRAAADATYASMPVAGVWQDIRAALQRIDPDLAIDERLLDYLSGTSVIALITIGCNIPVFAASHRHMSIKPIERPCAAFEWHNYFDPQDVLGWPLEPLSDEYALLVRDHCISVGNVLKSWTPLSHSQYWGDRLIVNVAVHQLQRGLTP